MQSAESQDHQRNQDVYERIWENSLTSLNRCNKLQFISMLSSCVQRLHIDTDSQYGHSYVHCTQISTYALMQSNTRTHI